MFWRKNSKKTLKAELGLNPYDFPSLYARQHRQQLPDLDFYVQLAQQEWAGQPARLIELGCGTGRLSFPLAAAGLSVAGVDMSRPMLAYARAARRASPIRIRQNTRFFHQDVCSLRLPHSFRGQKLIIFPYHSVGYIAPDRLASMARAVAQHLERGGAFVLSVLQPDASLCSLEPSPLRLLERFLDENGCQIDCYESTHLDKDSDQLIFDWYYDGECFSSDTMLHMHNPLFLHTSDSIASAFAPAGLQLQRSWGDFDLSPYTADSPELLQLYRFI